VLCKSLAAKRRIKQIITAVVCGATAAAATDIDVLLLLWKLDTHNASEFLTRSCAVLNCRSSARVPIAAAGMPQRNRHRPPAVCISSSSARARTSASTDFRLRACCSATIVLTAQKVLHFIISSAQTHQVPPSAADTLNRTTISFYCECSLFITIRHRLLKIF